MRPGWLSPSGATSPASGAPDHGRARSGSAPDGTAGASDPRRRALDGLPDRGGDKADGRHVVAEPSVQAGGAVAGRAVGQVVGIAGAGDRAEHAGKPGRYNAAAGDQLGRLLMLVGGELGWLRAGDRGADLLGAAAAVAGRDTASCGERPAAAEAT